jgi:uncharacterized domain HDIG
MTTRRVRDWANGERVWGALVGVRDVRLRPSGDHASRGPQLTLCVFDATGARAAKAWSLPETQVAALVAAAATDGAPPPVVRISGRVDDSERYGGELTVEGVTTLDDDEAAALDPEDFTGPLPPDHALLVAGLDRLIGSVADPHLAALLAETLGPDGRLRDRFLTAVAAKRNHHAYRGGLLRHSLEVAEIALHAARPFPEVRRDLVLTAALLHDVGKLWEMEHNWRQGEYTDCGELLGHVVLGFQRVGALCNRLGFPPGLRDELLHALLAHHDEPQFGAPVLPKTPEAVLVAKADQISAEVTQWAETTADGASGWCGSRRWFRRRAVPVAGLPESAPAVGGMDDDGEADPEERLLDRIRRAAAAAAPVSSYDLRLLPVLGTVAAGDGVRSAEMDGPAAEIREVAPPPGGADFLLRVTGDSMTGAGVLEGDLLLVRAQETARPGQMVVAHVAGVGAVVKRLTTTPEGERLLASENPAYPPIPVEEGVRVQGVVVRVERDLL